MMKLKSGILLLVLLLSCNNNSFRKNFLSFELRLARSESDLDLKEMVFYNSNEMFFVEDSVFLDNDDLSYAEVIDERTQPKVMVFLNDSGREKFSDFTKSHIGRNAAMLVDDRLVSAPRIQAQISGGRLIIVEFFSPSEAKSIAAGIVPLDRLGIRLQDEKKEGSALSR